MNNIFLLFIYLCFAAQIIFWLSKAPDTRRNIENNGGWTMRIIAVIVVLSVIFFKKQLGNIIPILNTYLWSNTSTISVIACLITFYGMLIMIWARNTLGQNWSANITFKENHELIKHGPYAWVRHPIYSGLLLMILGPVIYSGSVAGIILFGLFFLGAYLKAYREERLLINHFKEKYLQYKEETKAIIPLIF